MCKVFSVLQLNVRKSLSNLLVLFWLQFPTPTESLAKLFPPYVTFKSCCNVFPQVCTGMCGWCMSSRAACRVPRPSLPIVLETAAANSSCKLLERSTSWEPRRRVPATRQSGTVMCLNFTSSWLENKQRRQASVFSSRKIPWCSSTGNALFI